MTIVRRALSNLMKDSGNVSKCAQYGRLASRVKVFCCLRLVYSIVHRRGQRKVILARCEAEIDRRGSKGS